jgi:hypothetical protein
VLTVSQVPEKKYKSGELEPRLDTAFARLTRNFSTVYSRVRVCATPLPLARAFVFSRRCSGETMLRCASTFVVLLGLASSLSAADNDLPPGKMQGRVRSACTQCHRVANLTKQHLSRAAWAKTIDKMIGYGAEVNDKDKAALIDYLSTHFGPGNSGSVAKTARTGGKSVEN